LKDASKHGEFDFVEEMIAQSSHPRYRRIAENIGGRQRLSNPRLK